MKSQGLLGAFKKMECFLHFRLAVRTARVKPNLLSARNHHPRLLQFSRVQFHCVRTERGRKRERNSFHNSVTKSFLSLLISRSSAVDRVWLVGQHWARAVTSDFPQESPWCREDPFGTRVTSRRRVTVNSLYLPPVCCSQTFFFNKVPPLFWLPFSVGGNSRPFYDMTGESKAFQRAIFKSRTHFPKRWRPPLISGRLATPKKTK